MQAEIARQPRDLIRGHLPGNAPRQVVKPVRQQGFTLGKDASALGMRRYRDIGLTEELQNCARPDVLDPAVTVDPNRYGVFLRQKEMRQRLEASCVPLRISKDGRHGAQLPGRRRRFDRAVGKKQIVHVRIWLPDRNGIVVGAEDRRVDCDFLSHKLP